MKTKFERGGRDAGAGFTLAETLVVMSLFALVILGMVTANLYGLQALAYVKPKLGASEDARRAVNLLLLEVRQATLIRIGQGGSSSFTEIAANQPQQGGAIQIYPTTNMGTWVRYYLDAAESKLKRTSSGAVAPVLIACYVSNSMVFSAEDFRGNILTNNQNNRVIGLLLQFYQIEYPVTPVGPGQFFDYYQLRTRVTRRALL
jgi:type II secretory pathway pseudopilin PulG